MSDADARMPPPEGFDRMKLDFGFMGVNGPLFGRRASTGLALGCRIERRHCNPRDVAHGGWIATFMDMQLPLGARHLDAGLAGSFLPTISLQLDFLAAVPLGAWLEGETQLLRVTRNLVFAQGLARFGDTIAVRASGVFKRGPDASGTDIDLHRLFD